MKKSLKIISAVVLLAVIAVFGGCSQKREFGNGVYYSENNNKIYVTISDTTDTPDDETYIKSCKVQFSDTYDFTQLTEQFGSLMYNMYIGEHEDEFENLSEKEADKKAEELINKFKSSFDLKKQFSENACTFNLRDIEDNNFDILEAPIKGTEKYSKSGEALYFSISVDNSGYLTVSSDSTVFK